MAGLTIPTTFTAVDKFTAVVSKMTNATMLFTQKAAAGFARVERAERSLRNGIEKSLGVLGQFGLALSFLTVGQTMIASQVEAERSLASLSAVTGITGQAFVKYTDEVTKVSKANKMFVADTAKAFELIGSAKPELLANAEALGQVTNAALQLSRIGGMSVEEAANSLTKSMNQFGVGASEAANFVNIFANSQAKGTAPIQRIAESMVVAGGTARAFGVDFENANALLQAFAKGGVDGSQAGTMLAGVLAKLSKAQNKDFNPSFTKASDVVNNLAKANLSYQDLLKLTDAEGAKWLSTLINQNETVQSLTNNLHDKNEAAKADAILANTLSNRYTQLIASFKNATVSTDSNNKALNIAKDTMVFLADNMQTVVAVGASLIGVFIAYKTILIASKIAMFGYNIALGISVALQGKSAFFVSANTAAYAAFRTVIVLGTAATWLATTAQTAFAAALNLGLWPILAIVAGIALVIAIFANFGAIISDIKERWAKMINLFKAGDILGAFMVIGQSILKFILYPIEMILKLISKIPGVIGTTAGAALEKLNNVTGTVNVENAAAGEGKGMLLNPEATTERIRTERSIRTEEKRSILEIFDNTGTAVLSGNNSNIKLSSTLGF
jgi:TP901 family phage tail tape measure protein